MLRWSARPLSTPPSTPFCNSYPTRPPPLCVLWMRGSRVASPPGPSLASRSSRTSSATGSAPARWSTCPREAAPGTVDWDMWIGPSPWHPFNNRFHFVGEPKRVVPWDFNRDFAGGSCSSPHSGAAF